VRLNISFAAHLACLSSDLSRIKLLKRISGGRERMIGDVVNDVIALSSIDVGKYQHARASRRQAASI